MTQATDPTSGLPIFAPMQDDTAMAIHRQHFTQAHVDAYLTEHGSHTHFTDSLAAFITDDWEIDNTKISLAQFTKAFIFTFPFIKGHANKSGRSTRQCVACENQHSWLVATG